MKRLKVLQFALWIYHYPFAMKMNSHYADNGTDQKKQIISSHWFKMSVPAALMICNLQALISLFLNSSRREARVENRRSIAMFKCGVSSVHAFLLWWSSRGSNAGCLHWQSLKRRSVRNDSWITWNGDKDDFNFYSRDAVSDHPAQLALLQVTILKWINA